MSGSTLWTIVPLLLLLVVMYFLMIRPQKKREKETNAMRNSLQVGDEIVTIGGICGRVVKTKDETIILQVFPEKTKMEFMRWAVSKVVSEAGPRTQRSTDDYDEINDAEEKGERKGKPKRMKKAAPVEDAVEEVVEEVGDDE